MYKTKHSYVIPYFYRFCLWVTLLMFFPLSAWPWGFFAHKQINRYAITLLPPGMFRFYKRHLALLTEKAVNPDKRRYVFENEAERHFIDLEIYQDSLVEGRWPSLSQAIERYGKEVVVAHGQLPWTILQLHQQLTEAFIHKNASKIIKYSADLGHYVADAHVPLHTTQNYNGQMTDQEGIHALWESHLPSLFFDTYNFFIGHAQCITDPTTHIWHIVVQSHMLVPILLDLEKAISAQAIKKYNFQQKGSLLQKQYTLAFATAYHQALQGQVELRLRQSITEVGNFWLTAWTNAGSPNLDNF